MGQVLVLPDDLDGFVSITIEMSDEQNLEILVSKSPVDHTVVVNVDTLNLPEDDGGPRIRVYLNDEVTFENPPYPNTQRSDNADP